MKRDKDGFQVDEDDEQVTSVSEPYRDRGRDKVQEGLEELAKANRKKKPMMKGADFMKLKKKKDKELLQNETEKKSKHCKPCSASFGPDGGLAVAYVLILIMLIMLIELCNGYLSMSMCLPWLSYRGLLSSGVLESQYQSSSIVSYDITRLIILILIY